MAIHRGVFCLMMKAIMVVALSGQLRQVRSLLLGRPSYRHVSFTTSIRVDQFMSVPSQLSFRWTTSLSSSRHSAMTDNDSVDDVFSSITADDEQFLMEALDHAKIGFGYTFPNPAVGCVLVRQDTSEVIGRGFHPKAGFPHAEIFALLEAAGHVQSGVEAARSIVRGNDDGGVVQALADIYASTPDGPEKLFGRCLAGIPVTAYVTLEPCCHYGRTPPCAGSFALASVDRVVVGFRDPNPRVDGGGVKVLQEAGIQVDMATATIEQQCADLVDCFVKRIIPKEYDTNEYSHINGAIRRKLRSLAARKKKDGTLVQLNWGGKVAALSEAEVEDVELDAEWMERLDAALWKAELVNLRLNRVTNKKKMARSLAERIAKILGAHVAQSVGHTALLYRPGMPPVIDLADIGQDNNNDEDINDGDDES